MNQQFVCLGCKASFKPNIPERSKEQSGTVNTYCPCCISTVGFVNKLIWDKYHKQEDNHAATKRKITEDNK